MGCLCKRGSLSHSICSKLSKECIMWMHTPVIIKPMQYGLHIQHMSCLIWGVPLSIWGEESSVDILSGYKPYTGFRPVPQFSCPYRNNLLFVWIIYCHLWSVNSKLWVLHQSNVPLFSAAFKAKKTAPKLSHTHWAGRGFPGGPRAKEPPAKAGDVRDSCRRFQGT